MIWNVLGCWKQVRLQGLGASGQQPHTQIKVEKKL
jgi:hypothetical protein